MARGWFNQSAALIYPAERESYLNNTVKSDTSAMPGYSPAQEGYLSILGKTLSGVGAAFAGDTQWGQRQQKIDQEMAQADLEFKAALQKQYQDMQDKKEGKDFQKQQLAILAKAYGVDPTTLSPTGSGLNTLSEGQDTTNTQQTGFPPMVEGFTSKGLPRISMDTPVDQWQRGSKLRDELIGSKEYNNWKTTNDFSTSANAMYDAYKKGDIGRLTVDQTLISNLNKLNDPTSVTMISEYARTSNDMSLKNKFQGAIEKLSKGGAGLTDEDRGVLIKSINVIKDSRDKSFGSTLSNYRELAKTAKLNPDDVFKGLGVSPEKQKNQSGMLQTKSGLKYRVE